MKLRILVFFITGLLIFGIDLIYSQTGEDSVATSKISADTTIAPITARHWRRLDRWRLLPTDVKECLQQHHGQFYRYVRGRVHESGW